MSRDTLVLSGALDGPIPLKGTETIFDKIDKVMDKAIVEKNGWIAINALQELYEVVRLSSISLAKFLYEVVSNWDKLGIDEDVNAVLRDRLNIHKNTIKNYSEAWAVIQSGKIPEEHTERVVGRGIADILKITKMIDGGYEPTENQWEHIANASDRAELEGAIREVTNEPVSERAIFIQMEMDGTVNVYHLGEKHFVCKMEVGSGVYAVQKAIYRMSRGGGVSRK